MHKMFTKMSFFKRKLRSLSWYIFNKIENNGNANLEENGEKEFLKNLIKTFQITSDRRTVVFDIGANTGKYSSMLLKLLQSSNVELEIHLFEPTKSSFAVLVEEFRNKKNIFLNNFGASNENRYAEIFYDVEKSGLASLYQRNLKAYNLELNKSETIELRRIDEYIEEKKLKHINFVKIDVEGHELKVLDGFGKFLNIDFVDFIQFEYGGANLDSHTSLLEIYKFLEDRNFIIAKIMPNGLQIRKYQPFMENFMYSNYVANSKEVVKNDYIYS